MKVTLSPKIKRLGPQTAYLYQDDELVAIATHETVEDGFGGSRPEGDITFEIERACRPTHVKICGHLKPIDERLHHNLLCGDSYTIVMSVEIERFVRPWSETTIGP